MGKPYRGNPIGGYFYPFLALTWAMVVRKVCDNGMEGFENKLVMVGNMKGTGGVY
jgi:hypothetical protein